MQPAVSSRTPISSVRGSSSPVSYGQPSLSRFSSPHHVDQNGNCFPSKGNDGNHHHNHRRKLKALKIQCDARGSRSGANGAHGIQKTLENLAKLWTSPPSSDDNPSLNTIEKLIHQSRCGVGSPKQDLGHKWREYQGSNNWLGLLDPLDENLRREIVKYGEFVQAAYSAFEFDQQKETYGCCKYSEDELLRKVGLDASGYRVTGKVHATSGIRVPQWLTRLLDGNNSISKQTSFMGFVAVCTDEREIFRAGRRDIVVAFRGTVTPLEWAENLKDVLMSINTRDGTKSHGFCQPKVESGFWSLFTTKCPRGRSACDQVLNAVHRLVDLYKDETLSVTVTGHSLGAALSLLTAHRIAEELGTTTEHKIPVTVFSFGGPRVGNRAFGRRMEEVGAKVLRIVNMHDVITKVPGVFFNETWMHSMKEQCRNLRKVVGFLEKMPWAYCHVGAELRVNNKHSPFLKPDADMSCCHDLEAYLHLVDGFLSSAIPFRSTAKRDLVRLLINQKSNVLLDPNKRISNLDKERIGNLDKEISWP